MNNSDIQTIKPTKVTSGSKFTAKVFLYMLIGILITAIVACGVGAIFTYSVGSPTQGGVFKQELAIPYYITMIVAAIGIIPIIIWVNCAAIKGKGNAWVPYIIYTILMGVLISGTTMFIPFYIIGLAFGITSVAFVAMFLIGYLVKKDLSFLALAGFGLLAGLGIMCLINLVWWIIFPATFVWFYWIIEAGLLVFITLVTIADANRIRQIQDSGIDVPDLAIVCALSLYTDFIYIFLRVLLLILRIFAVSR